MTDLKQKLLQMAIRRARVDFKSYVYLMAPVVLPEPFVSGKHIDQIADEISKVAREKNKRYLVELPPGSMKSVLCSVLLASWLFGQRPNLQIMQISHSEELAAKFGRKVRDLLEMQQYALIFPKTKVSEASRAADRWDTTAGGGYLAAGATKSIAGFRGNVIIADDLLSEQTAKSETERKKVIENWHGGIASRLLPNGSIIIVNTRWHVMDVAGYVLKQQDEIEEADKWTRLRYTPLHLS